MKLSTTILFLVIPLIGFAQDLHYEIVRHGDIVGSLEILHTRTDSMETFRSRNNVEMKVIFTFSVEYAMTETFENGTLISGEGYNTLNGVFQKQTRIRLKDDGYHLKIDGIEAHNEKKPIRQSMSRIYHQEPEDGQKLYSQYFGQYLDITKLGEHKYSLDSPDGENIYWYENGYCTEVKVIRDFATFYIRMKPETLATIRQVRE